MARVKVTKEELVHTITKSRGMSPIRQRYIVF